MKIYICFIFLICILYFLIVETVNNNLIKEYYSLCCAAAQGVLALKVYKDLTIPENFKIELLLRKSSRCLWFSKYFRFY